MIQIGYYFPVEGGSDFNIVCISDKNIESDKNKKDEFIDLVNNLITFLKDDFVGIITVGNEIPGWNQKNKQFLAIYSMKSVINELSKQLYKFNNEIYDKNNIEKLKVELKMSTPYKFWTVKSLKDELKRRSVPSDEYKDIDDKDVLVNMIEALDRKRKSPVNNENKTKQKKEEKAMKRSKKTQDSNPVKDRFSKLETTKDLLAAKRKYGLDCKLYKSLSLEENQGILRKAYTAKKSAEVESEKSVKSVKSKSKKETREKSTDKKPSKVDDKKSTGKKLSKTDNKKKLTGKVTADELPESYLEKKRARVKKRNAERRKSITPELKRKIDAFKKKYKGKNINWNVKLKKAGLWINGMNFLSNYEKYEILDARGTKQKKLLNAAQNKIKSVADTIKGTNAFRAKVIG